MANVIFKVGTKVLFNQLEQKDTNTLYWLTDTHEIYKGDVLFGVGLEATQEAAGLLSPEDKAKLDNLAASTVAGLSPVDASIVITDGENGTKNIGVGLSSDEGNILSVHEDGLFASLGTLPEDVTLLQQSVATLNGTGDGSVQKKVDDAINEFANKVSDDGAVNTIKELVDYVAEHAPESADMAADITSLQGLVDSLPDEILSEIVNVNRTDTTNTAEIRIFTKQEDGTYSPNVQHGVLTLISAGYGADGKTAAGLLSLADKQKLDSIDPETISSLAQSLEWGTM